MIQLFSFFKFFSRTRFRKEIALVICVKLLALYLLWQFFLTPIDKTILSPPALLEHYTANRV